MERITVLTPDIDQGPLGYWAARAIVFNPFAHAEPARFFLVQ